MSAKMADNLVAEYVRDTSNWEDWKQEYQYGALYIFPPDEIRQNINQLRSKYDPKSQAICDAHISLTVPFARSLTESSWRKLEDQVGAIGSIELELGPIHQFPGVPGVVLLVEPADFIRDTVASLERGSVFEGAKERKYRFTPHMTIAEFISLEDSEKLCAELKDGIPNQTFTCERLSYAVPDESFHFSERKFLNL